MQTKLDLYQRIAPLLGLGIWEQNFVTGEIYWNKMLRQLLEVDDDFIPELDDLMKFYKHPALVRQLIKRVIKDGATEVAELELTTARGLGIWVKVRMQGDCVGGRCERIYGTLEDITPNVRLLHMLQERESRFFQAFDYAPIGMALVSLAGEWIKVNQSLVKLLGYQEEVMLKKTFQDYTHPDDLNSDLSKLRKLVEGEIDSYTLEKRYRHANGHFIWAMLSVSLVKDETGKPSYFVSQIKDISEAKQNMQIISDQNTRLLNFAHIVSHNLRSHTGNIRMLTDAISAEANIEEQKKLIAMLDVNSANLLETLNNLNDVIKVHEKGALERVSISLKSEVQRVVDILAGSVLETAAKIKADIRDDIIVKYNPAYLESILINLISNSLKYKHPDRAPEIRISANRDGAKVNLCVADNGLGIDLRLHGHKLFGMYKTFHRHPDARGMGLFMVKNQVEAMGGKISVASNPGSGAAFTIEFC